MSKSTVWPESALDKLGKVKDMDIATEFGMSRATVRNKRIELGISAYDELKWTAKMDEKLGTKTDVKLAEELGISVKSVRRRRAGLNIPAHEKTIWTAERESLLGTKPDTEIAKITGLTIEQVIYRRRMLRIPKFNDKRAKNGGHSTAGKAGRPTITDRKVSKTVAMRQWAWDWLDDPKNGAARGDIIEQLISDKIQQQK